jgi:hypothetical protein
MCQYSIYHLLVVLRFYIAIYIILQLLLLLLLLCTRSLVHKLLLV